MQILPSYIASLNKVLESLVEEVRLHIIEHAYSILDKLDVFSLTSEDIALKVSMVGLEVQLKDSALFTPAFYRVFRRLKSHRSTLPACNFIAKTGGFLEFVSAPVTTSIQRLLSSSLVRDYKVPLGTSDGYIYFDEEFKEYLTRQDLIYYFLPMGYSYAYLTKMYPRSAGLTGSVLPYWWLRSTGRDYGYRSDYQYDYLWRRRSYIDSEGDEHELPEIGNWPDCYWEYSPWYAGQIAEDSLTESLSWLFHITNSINDYPSHIENEQDKSFWNIIINRDYVGADQLNFLSPDKYYLFMAFFFVLSKSVVENGSIRWRDMGTQVSGDVPVNNIMSTNESLGLRGISLEDVLKERRRFTNNLFFNGRLEHMGGDLDSPDPQRITSQFVEVDCFVQRTVVPIEVEDKEQDVYMNSASLLSISIRHDASVDPI